MLFIWLTFLIEVLVLGFIKPLITDFESIGLISVLLHALLTFIYLLSWKKYRLVIIIGFLLRIILLCWDIYGRGIYLLPVSGSDSEDFFSTAIFLSENIDRIFQSVYGGVYTKSLAILFYFIGPQRIFAQYINVLLSISSVIVVYKIVKSLNVGEKSIKLVVFIAAIFPASIMLSAVLLRESFITLMVACSLYYFVKWFSFPKFSFAILSIITLGIGSMFHSGVISILAGYAFLFMFYHRETRKLQFSSRSVIIFGVFCIIMALVITRYNNIFLQKFYYEDINQVYDAVNIRKGNTAYLQNISINNPFDLLVYGPLKAFYFITSPLPPNWRGFEDLLTFFTDSIFYLFILFKAFRDTNKLNNRKALVLGICVMLISVIFLFGLGVSNAGTALRHRQKFISIFLLLLALLSDKDGKPQKEES